MKRSIIICLLVLTVVCFTCIAYADETEQITVDNGIPVVYINIDESDVTIEEMNESPDHSVTCEGTMSLTVPEGFRYSDMPDDAECVGFTDIDIKIRGRGNSSWEANKKPYKIKLDKKTDVFGLGANKHWVLLANAFDPTLNRDRITAWLGNQLGFGFTPTGYPVDVVMTGSEFGSKYIGSYILSEQVRVGENRVEIAELDETASEGLDITGGYLLQNPAQLREDSADIYTLDSGEQWATDTPTYDVGYDDDAYENPAQQQYIKSYLQKLDDALVGKSGDYKDYMDMESAAKYWLVNQFTMNGDGYATGSTYIYKDKDTEAAESKLFWGPLWDFDYAYEQSDTIEGFQTNDGVWENALLSDKGEGGFIDEVVKYWPEMKGYLQEVTRDGGILDQYYEETKASAEKDIVLNPTEPGGGYIRPSEMDIPETYEGRIERLKNWINNRMAWMDEHMTDLYQFMYRISYVVDGETEKVEFQQTGSVFTADSFTPEKEGYVFTGWADESGEIVTEAEATRDITFTATFVTEEEATKATDIVFRHTSDVEVYNPNNNIYYLQYTVIPTNAQDKSVKWSSSDESIATVDESGAVTCKMPGTVVITGTLKDGSVHDFTLKIADEIIIPESIHPENEVIRLTVGQQAGFNVVTDPDPAKLMFFEYDADDYTVAFVNEDGVIKARGAGETKIYVTASVIDEESETHEYSTWATVIVTGEGEDIEPMPEPMPEPVSEEVCYTVVSGADAAWIRGSDEDLTVTVKRSVDDDSCFDHFTGAAVDGKELSKDKDYTAVRGSTAVTLKAAYLEGLSEGTHKVEIAFDDGKAETTLTIDPAMEGGAEGESSTPKTGDATNFTWFFVMIPALSGLLMILKKR